MPNMTRPTTVMNTASTALVPLSDPSSDSSPLEDSGAGAGDMGAVGPGAGSYAPDSHAFSPLNCSSQPLVKSLPAKSYAAFVGNGAASHAGSSPEKELLEKFPNRSSVLFFENSAMSSHESGIVPVTLFESICRKASDGNAPAARSGNVPFIDVPVASRYVRFA